ncbi:MAG TPA: pyruvate kinase [Candidatus Dormibacteraeota bacterium]|nr:pyruvate kinase [Candidatus Dormibacteraeota bacterium]
MRFIRTGSREKIGRMRPRLATKIVCTIGPASSSPTALGHMIRAGMDVGRINFSHGTYEDHLKSIKTIRKVSHSLRRPVAILQDLPGPKLRVGKLAVEPLHLRRLDIVTLTTKPSKAKGKIPVAYAELPKTVKRRDMIYLADGSIRLEVVSTSRDEVEGRVMVGGDLVSGKGVNLPRLRTRVPAITPEDREHLKFGIENGVDLVAVSFVQRAEDIRAARKVAGGMGREIFAVAKIEKREAVDDLEEIVKEADAVMVARGDLGVELNLERIPIVQKRIIFEANRQAKPVITATQMLESMISSPTPTRAEVTDAANAIIDGSDALMLSEETAVGKYPVEAVRVLQKVAQETERFLPKEITQQRRAWHENSQEDAIAFAACETALQISATAIVTPTRTGKTARRVSKYRPPLPIVSLTSQTDVEKQLLLSWGVQTVRREIDWTDTIYTEAEETVKRLGLARKGDTIVIVSGDPKGPMGRTDLLKIQRVR